MHRTLIFSIQLVMMTTALQWTGRAEAQFKIPAPKLPSVTPPKLPPVPAPKIPSIPPPKIPTVSAPKLPAVSAPKLPTVSAPKMPTVAASKLPTFTPPKPTWAPPILQSVHNGTGKVAAGLNPVTQTPTQFGRNVLTAPVALGGAAVIAPFGVLQGVSNAAKGRPLNYQPPPNNSTLSSASSTGLQANQKKPSVPLGTTSRQTPPFFKPQLNFPQTTRPSLPSPTKLPDYKFPTAKPLPKTPYVNPFGSTPKSGPLFPGTPGFNIPHPKVDIKLPERPIPKLKDGAAKKDPHVEKYIPTWMKPTQGGSSGNQNGGGRGGSGGKTEVGGMSSGMIKPIVPKINVPKVNPPKVNVPYTIPPRVNVPNISPPKLGLPKVKSPF